MSRFNTSTNHPIIPNSQDYIIEKKYVSIHSEDRNILKYPNSNEFELELPQDYLNVYTVKLSTWTFPANYNTFSFDNGNVIMTFKFDNIYNPFEHGVTDPLEIAIYQALVNHYNTTNVIGTNDFIVRIQDGFYNPDQMATELTNRFNQSVTDYLYSVLDPSLGFDSIDGYNEFIIVYNDVGQNMWFGNRSSSFTLTNSTQVSMKRNDYFNQHCKNKNSVPDFSDFGLASNMGFSPLDIPSITTSDLNLARFYYGPVGRASNGIWLRPSYPGAEVSYIQAPYKLNNMGPSHFYMEISGLNCMDETAPYSDSCLLNASNITNGIVNSAFAKIGVITTPLQQWYDYGIDSFKFFNPPAERIRRLKFKFRYHNGALVQFGKFNYSFTLEFTMFTPQTVKNMNSFNSYISF